MRFSKLASVFVALISVTPALADHFEMSSGYQAGVMNVSVFGEKDGLVSTVASYLVAAGAVATTVNGCPACPYTLYQFPNDNTQSIMVRQPDPAIGIHGYEWNFNLGLKDNIQVNRQGAGLGFSGNIAQTLYEGLAKGGATNAGYTPDAQGKFIIPIFSSKGTDFSIWCQKQVSKVSCYLGM